MEVHRMRIAVLAVALLSIGSHMGCSGPTVLLPGGALDGTKTQAPADWSFTDETSTVQLETRPSDPYSVNIWVIALGPNLYVHAGANRSEWVDHMETDPNVRLRVGDAIYELSAARVTEQAEFDRFADAYERKYDRRPRNETIAEVYLYRLASR
jgi:hypothetical protein